MEENPDLEEDEEIKRIYFAILNGVHGNSSHIFENIHEEYVKRGGEKSFSELTKKIKRDIMKLVPQELLKKERE